MVNKSHGTTIYLSKHVQFPLIRDVPEASLGVFIELAHNRSKDRSMFLRKYRDTVS